MRREKRPQRRKKRNLWEKIMSGDGNGLDSGLNLISRGIKEKAEKEIGEKECWRERDIEALRDLIANDDLMSAPEDDVFLLKFLRSRGFDYDMAYNGIKSYYTLQALSPELFVSPSKLRHLFEDNVLAVLPKKLKGSQETIIVFAACRWDIAKSNFETLAAGFIVSIEKALMDQVSQISGFIIIIDMSDVGWNQLKAFGPTQAKKTMHILEEALPIRIKEVHIINIPSLALATMQVIRPFLSEELTTKTHLHHNDLTHLHRTLPKDILPLEFGGTQGPIDGRLWFQQVVADERALAKNWRTPCNGYGVERDPSVSLSQGPREGFQKMPNCASYFLSLYKQKI